MIGESGRGVCFLIFQLFASNANRHVGLRSYHRWFCMEEAPTTPENAPPAQAGFWRRRVLQPIRMQLTQGVSPDQIAATVAVGTACSLFPIFGITSFVNLGVGLTLRMNQPILQALNQLLGPLQLALILIYIRVGEFIWRSAERQLTLTEMLREFRERRS